MSDGAEPKKPAPKQPDSEEWRRKRRLREVFGDELDPVAADPGESPHSGRSRSWYEEQKPPHHG